MRASPSLARASLCAGLLWLATRRSYEASGTAALPGPSGPGGLLHGTVALPSLVASHRRAVAPKTARAAAATWDPSYFEAANAGNVNPSDFVNRYWEGAVDTVVVEAQLVALKIRASCGFRSAFQELTGQSVLRQETAAAEQAAPSYSFQARDDPEILVHNEQGELIKRHHYLGPAVMLFFDKGGALKHIDFVGVCDSCGGNRQGPDADYVGEHARLYVQTGQWKYRDECGRNIAEVSDCDWASEKPASWRPDPTWLQPFMDGKTFVLHAHQPSIIEGPRFGTIWNMAVAPELNQLDFDRSQANEWVKAILFVVGSAQGLNNLKKDAEELLCYAIMYGMAMADTGPQLAATTAGR